MLTLPALVARLREMTVEDHPFVGDEAAAPAVPSLVAFVHTSADFIEALVETVGEEEAACLAGATFSGIGAVLAYADDGEDGVGTAADKFL